MKLVFDVGMYDGSDTEYYLSEGHKVIAVEANPNLIEIAQRKFEKQVSSGRLVLVNRAICSNSEYRSLTISGKDLGSSSIIEDNVMDKNPLGQHTIKGMTVLELIEEYGTPYFMKIDIEGADRHCILPLDKQNRPRYISFEAGDDIEELVQHLSKIGYTLFKV